MNTKSVVSGSAVVLAAILAAYPARGAVTIDVYAASAPNAFGSPSYAGWYDNAINALYAGVSTYGNPALPTYYSQAGLTMSVTENIVTGFPSWKGQANPGTVFGPAFGSELGNRLAFGLVAKGNGDKIAIADLGFSAVSTDPFATLSFGFGVGSYNYSDQYRGLLYGTDNIRGTIDDVWVTSGPATQQVDEIIGRGSGNAWPIYLTDPGATEQDKIDGMSALFELGNGQFDFTGEYTLGSAKGSDTVTFQPVPEPSSIALFGIGLCAIIGRIRRR